MLLKLLICSLLFLHGVRSEDGTSQCVTPKVYSEIGCEPVIEEGEKCPKRFNCDSLANRDPGMCYHRGEAYNDTAKIPDTERNCQAGCFCRDGVITCASIECPELFGSYKKDCAPQYAKESCCAHDYICDPEEMEKLPKCFMDGREYRAGSQIYPESASCYKCLCVEGFDNTTKIEDNPNCYQINCGIELHSSDDIRDGCIPIYYKKPTCCPIGWRCPKDSDTVLELEGRTNEDSDPKMECSFGKLKLNVGNQLSPEDGPKVKCECSIPPIVTCVRTS
ncbi:uncharacterized protein DMENIID0001_058640 [Sergentomyia squamirostris]